MFQKSNLSSWGPSGLPGGLEFNLKIIHVFMIFFAMSPSVRYLKEFSLNLATLACLTKMLLIPSVVNGFLIYKFLLPHIREGHCLSPKKYIFWGN